jgi:uncharacterized membrane protein YphA (DoxX/SURF4 family)
MERLAHIYNTLDESLTSWMRRHGINMLRKSIGFIFIWFGVLKFFPGLSPAENIAVDTIRVMTFGIAGDKLILIGLATLETLIGAGLLFNLFMRGTLFLLFVQMAGTFFPIILFPGAVFTEVPIALTLEGQYIIKNLVIVSAGIVIGSTVRKPDVGTKSVQE